MNMTCTGGVVEFDLKKCLEAMRKAASIEPPRYDVVVTTDAAFKEIRDHVQERRPVTVPPFGLEALSIDGMDILAYPTEADALCAALALAYEGKRAILVTQEVPPKCGENA